MKRFFYLYEMQIGAFFSLLAIFAAPFILYFIGRLLF